MIPKHIAIVMDGNGRWAQRRGHPRVFGHVRGTARVKMIVREAQMLGVEALTLYAFSTENWRRPEHERRVLWSLLKKFLQREIGELARQNIRLRIIGERDRLDDDIREVIQRAEQSLAGMTGMELTFAVSYGARLELMHAARSFAEACIAGQVTPSSMSVAVMEQYLWAREVDLLIRTGGEKRLSNFLLWQSAYAECIFTECCWPDFGPRDLRQAIDEFQGRERRFGGLDAC